MTTVAVEGRAHIARTSKRTATRTPVNGRVSVAILTAAQERAAQRRAQAIAAGLVPEVAEAVREVMDEAAPALYAAHPELFRPMPSEATETGLMRRCADCGDALPAGKGVRLSATEYLCVDCVPAEAKRPYQRDPRGAWED